MRLSNTRSPRLDDLEASGRCQRAYEQPEWQHLNYYVTHLVLDPASNVSARSVAWDYLPGSAGRVGTSFIWTGVACVCSPRMGGILCHRYAGKSNDHRGRYSAQVQCCDRHSSQMIAGINPQIP